MEQPEGSGDVGAWLTTDPPDAETATAYVGLVEQIRRFQALVTGARPTPADSRAAAKLVAEAADLLAGSQVPEERQIAGKQVAVPGRAQAFVPPLVYDRVGPDEIEGHATFSRYYIGGGMAAHGGSITLLYDEALGRLAGSGGRSRSRTAYLHVDYRSITPLDREVQVRAHVDRIEGRKIFTVASMWEGDRLLNEANALFVLLLPGQP